MSHEELHREPRAAYCEDYDDDEDEVATPLANVAAKRADVGPVTKRASYERRRNDGSDSGYSSKTNTNTSTSSSRRDVTDLKLDTTMERQPQPYAFVQRPEPSRRDSSRTRQTIVEPPSPMPKPKPNYYVHKQEEGCYVCDTYGQHLPEHLRPSRDNPMPPRPVRRDSSVRSSRPVSMYAPVLPQFSYQPTQAPSALQYTPMSPAGWTTPYSPFSYTPSVMSTTYASEPSYFEIAPPRENRPSKPNKRYSVHGDVIIRQSKADTRSVEPRSTASTRDHSRADPDRSSHAADYDNMPPPPRPTVTLAHRPTIKKSATYNTALTATSNRRSRVVEDEVIYVPDSTAPSPSRERKVESSLPPSSYRGPVDALDSRPPTRKSVSYSTASGTTAVSSSAQRPTLTLQPRRSTTTAAPSETRKLVDAVEEYQAQRRSLTSNDLTAEALRTLKQRKSSSRSETGSQKSHHTKSSSSGGGKSKRSNSDIKMVINGVNVLIPNSTAKDQNISISTRKDGGIGISLGGRGDRDDDGLRAGPQKRIEKAPSASSRASRASSKSVGSKEKERERERERERESKDDLEQYVRARTLSTTGRSRSRAEAVRRSYDRGANSPNPWDD